MELDLNLAKNISNDKRKKLEVSAQARQQSLASLERRLFVVVPLSLGKEVRLEEIQNAESSAEAIIERSGVELDFLGIRSFVTYVGYDPGYGPEMVDPASGGNRNSLNKVRRDRSKVGRATEQVYSQAVSSNHDTIHHLLGQRQVAFMSPTYHESTLPAQFVQSAVHKTTKDFEKIIDNYGSLEISRTGLLLIIHSGDAERALNVDKKRILSGEVAMLTKAGNMPGNNKFQYLS